MASASGPEAAPLRLPVLHSVAPGDANEVHRVGAAEQGQQPVFSISSLDQVMQPKDTSAEAIMKLPPGLYTMRMKDQRRTDQEVVPWLHPQVAHVCSLDTACRAAILPIVSGENGLVQKHHFQSGPNGAAAAAVDALVADLTGAPGPPKNVAEAIDALHAQCFSNYMIWASFVRAETPSTMHISATSNATVLAARLTDLALWYLIRVELGCLRFCPEMVCWLYHQMRVAAGPPPATLPDGRPAPRSFMETTVKPLYAFLLPNATSVGTVAAARAASRRAAAAAPPQEVPADKRFNLDDLNETFWDPGCLQFTYHTLDPARRFVRMGPLKKTFRERPSYLAILVNTYPYWQFYATHLHVCIGVAQAIVIAQGVGFQDIGQASIATIFNQASYAILTLCVMHLLHVFLALYHDPPESRGRVSLYTEAITLSRRSNTVIKLLYAAAWTAGFFVLAFIGGWVGSGLWWGLIGARLAFILLANGFAHPIARDSYIASGLENYLAELEKVDLSVPISAPLGGNLLRQPSFAVFMNALLWIVVIGIKTIFDIQVLTQNLANTGSILASSTSIPLSWGLVSTGYANIWIVIFLWILVGLLIAVDSYIVFSLITPCIGAIIVSVDGIGRIRSFEEAMRRMHASTAGAYLQLEEVFVKKCAPFALQAQSALEAALKRSEAGGQAASGLPDGAWLRHAAARAASTFIWARIWNRFMESLRAEDLLSDAEYAHMCYDTSDASRIRHPLFLYGPAARRMLSVVDEFRRNSPSTAGSVAMVHAEVARREPLGLEAMNEVQHASATTLEFCLRLHPDLRTTALCGEAASYVQKPDFLTHLLMAPDMEKADFLDATDELFSLVVEPESQLSAPGAPSAFFAAVMRALQAVSKILPAATGSTSQAISAISVPVLGMSSLHDSVTGLRIQPAYNAVCAAAFRGHALLSRSKFMTRPAVGEATRRIVFFCNSLYMRQLRPSSSCLAIPSFTPVTPHYAEAVLYDMTFLNQLNEHGVSSMVYLRALHPQEWANFKERIGAADDDAALRAADDAGRAGIPLRMWASFRGQTLARTVCGIMEYGRAMRDLTALELTLRQYVHHCTATGASPPTHFDIDRVASVSADWWTSQRFSYICCAQKYADTGAEDVARRADIDILLSMHPLLFVVCFSKGMRPAGAPSDAPQPVMATCTNAILGDVYRIVVPGHPIADGITEGKPANQDNAQPFMRGHIVQAIDMNQAFSWEEGLKIMNVLNNEFQPKEYGRPVALVGTREHIFTNAFSTSALFMSYQEIMFGVVWQRVMATPLRVRLHYGHPDFISKTFMSVRGGFAKASKVINVSEDVFAGINAMLRGGTSRHIEYLQLGKGRDIGMMQIAQFEAKVSGGSAVSITTRDAVRLTNNLEFFRMMSLFHTWAGYYTFNVIVVLSSMLYMWYLAIMGLSGAADTIIGAPDTEIVNPSSIALFVVQLGALWYLPMLTMLIVEFGVLDGIWRLVHLIFTFGPLFYVAEMQTKAYYFDQALSFGKPGYLATGRSFVIRHMSFDEIYRSVAHSHLYIGFEAMFLLIVWHIFGNWGGVVGYVFIIFGSWVFTLALIFCMLWFNPFALDVKYGLLDAKRWLAWLSAPSTSPDSYAAWFRSSNKHYATATLRTRIYHTFRLLRWAVLALAFLFRPPFTRSSATAGLSEALTPIIWLFASITILMLIHACFPVARWLYTSVGGGTVPTSTTPGAPISEPKGLQRITRILHASLLGVCIAVAIILIIFGATLGNLTASAVFTYLTALCIGLWMFDRLAIVWNIKVFAAGVEALAKCFDIIIGAILLGVQLAAAALLPLGGSLHNAMMFTPGYAQVLDRLLHAKAEHLEPEEQQLATPQIPNATPAGGTAVPRSPAGTVPTAAPGSAASQSSGATTASVGVGTSV